MKISGKLLSLLLFVFILTAVFAAESAIPPPPVPPPNSPVSIVNQTVRGNISHTIQGQGGIIEIQITGNTVDGNILLNIVDNKDVLKIKVVVSQNEVYEGVRIRIQNNDLNRPSSKEIETTVERNNISKSLILIIGDNFVMEDIKTNVNINKIGEDMRVSIGAGDAEGGYGNIVSSIDTTISNNTVCREIDVNTLENTLDFTLNTLILKNRASDNIDIDLSENTYPQRYPQLFTALIVTISDNHVVFEDISILIIKNKLALSGLPIVFIDIFENGAGKDIFMNIMKNMAPPGIFDLTIRDNAADNNMAVLVQGNIAATILIVIKDNFAYNWRPHVDSQKPALEQNNIQMDLQAQGGDSDGDGLSDVYENRIIGTNPGKDDTDDDGLFDGWHDITGDKKADFGGGGVFEEEFGEFGDPRQNKKGSNQRQNAGSISTLFNNKKENPSPICQDIYIEVDSMPSHKPNPQDFKRVSDAFDKHLIHVHIDSGWAKGSASNRIGGEMLPKVDVILLNSRQIGPNNDFYDFKDNHFDSRRQGIFHYVVFGIKFQENLNTTGAAPFSITGFSDGDDFFIADANVLSFASSLGADKGTAQAGIFMHELGHNLGLVSLQFAADFNQTLYEGIDNDTTFPLHTSYNASAFVNYKSVMNYKYTLVGPVDYSDGKHGSGDFNDWAAINLRRIVDFP